MPASASVASEYYKLQDIWKKIDSDHQWRLAIWSVKDEDVILVDKFLEVEQSPLGVFDDIYFRFGSSWEGDPEAFNIALWEEYISWFEENIPEQYDVYGAIKKDGLLITDYEPDRTLEKTPPNLWKEMLRFKSCIQGLEERNFCLCLPVARYDAPEMTDWFDYVLDEGVPAGIRLVTVDTADNRKVKLKPSKKVVVLSPQLKMREALDNDMDKNSGSFDPVDPGNQFDKQLRITMECATKKNDLLLTTEVNKLYACSAALKQRDIELSTPLIAAQAYFMAGVYEKSLFHADKAISMSKEAMVKNMEDKVAYTVWLASMYQKGAVLTGQKQREKAIAVYEEVAEEASERKEALHIMESYRMSGYLNYELRKNEDALGRFLLSLYAGSYLDIETRRQSTFLYSAHLALLLSRENRGAEDIEIIERQIEEWLGDDWRELVESDRMKEANKRGKASIFSS